MLRLDGERTVQVTGGNPGLATSAVRVGGVGSEVAWGANLDREKPNQVAEGNPR